MRLGAWGTGGGYVELLAVLIAAGGDADVFFASAALDAEDAGGRKALDLEEFLAAEGTDGEVGAAADVGLGAVFLCVDLHIE